MRLDEKISLKKIGKEHLKILCYPKCQKEEAERRPIELEKLGVRSLEFVGEKNVFGISILGKGFVGVVVVAHTDNYRAALKIRRIDSDRKTMFHEAEMLKKANSVGVGPKLFGVSENFLLMEIIEGKHFPEWINSLQGENESKRIHLALTNILEQCYRLDQAGLDHGELSRAQKHIIVNSEYDSYLIDFETASKERRVSNVTSICQYFFLGSQVAAQVREKIDIFNEKELINDLRSYKKERSRENFNEILKNFL